jgi:AraC-like DNA-binding protein
LARVGRQLGNGNPAVSTGTALRRFRSVEIPQRDRFRAWQNVLTPLYPGSTIRQPKDEPFFASIRYRSLPQIRLSWGTLGATLNTRTRGEHNDDFSLFVNVEGTTLASQHGREFELGPGDAYLMAYGEPGSLDRWTGGAIVGIRVSNEAIAPFVRDAHDCIGRSIPRDTEGLRLLARYVQLLDDREALETERERALVGTHVLDLMALALGAAGDARRIAGSRGREAALLKTMNAYIERNAAQSGLSLESVAARFAISPRKIQRLFEGEGTTLTHAINERRLLLAHRMLANRRYASYGVGEIALASGFGDFSYFNRSFRRRFGMTPSDVRNRHAE